MKTKPWPYDKPSPGIKDFGDSLCVAAVYDDTRIDVILKRFRVSGVLPSVGRTSLPADVVFGGEDFSTLRARLDEARAAGVTLEQIEEYYKNGNIDSDADTADSEHGTKGGLEPAPGKSGTEVAAAGGQA